MFFFFLFIALTNLVLGYYLGILWPIHSWKMLFASGVSTLESSAPFAMQLDVIDAKPGALAADLTKITSPTAAETKAAIPEQSHHGWNTAGPDMRHDISTLRDRIRYALQANDKKITQELAFEMQCQTSVWEQFLHDKLTANAADLERDPAAKVDCVAPELCLAQLETMQSNLKLLDWSDASESILRKLEREVEAMMNLLPSGM